MNEGITYGSVYPFLLKFFLPKLSLKKASDLMKLSLSFVFVIFKPFGCVEGFNEFSVEQAFSEVNPWSINEKEFVAGLIHKGIVYSTNLLFILVLRARG